MCSQRWRMVGDLFGYPGFARTWARLRSHRCMPMTAKSLPVSPAKWKCTPRRLGRLTPARWPHESRLQPHDGGLQPLGCSRCAFQQSRGHLHFPPATMMCRGRHSVNEMPSCRLARRPAPRHGRRVDLRPGNACSWTSETMRHLGVPRTSLTSKPLR